MSTIGMEPYEALRNAIVVQAAKDYRTAAGRINRANKKIASFEAALEVIKAAPEPYPETAEADIRSRRIADLERKVDAQKRIIDAGRREVVQIEKFFLSEWYKSICNVDGKMIITELRKEAGYVEG